MPAHSQRTPEIFPPALRDTSFMVNGVARKVSLPQGFTISQFARIPQCRGLCLSPDGVLYATSYDSERVIALPDHDHDGTPDSVITVIPWLNNPHGVGFYNNELYFSDVTHLYRAQVASGSRLVTNTETLGTFPAGGHITRNFVVDSAHSRFLVQVGSASNMDESDLEHRATIQCFDVFGRSLVQRTYAKGLRNAVGMDLDPRTGALWVNNNGMDNLFTNTSGNAHRDSLLSDDNPSEGVYLVCDGANYGWPYAYGYQMRNPQSPYKNLDTNTVRAFSGPVAEVLAHEAPLGLHFYRGSTFPKEYKNAIFQCYHGSWNRYPPSPPRVTVMWADSDGRNARVSDFINGFFLMGSKPDSGNGTRWGRPVSVIEGADSALYISDDQAGAIYRVRWTGTSTGGNASVHPQGIHFSVSDPIPNPGRGAFNVFVTLDEPATISTELYNLLGEIVAAGKRSFSPGRHELPFEGISSGSYILRVSVGDEVLSKRVLISR